MTEEVKTKAKSSVSPFDVENVLDLREGDIDGSLKATLRREDYYKLAAANGLSKKNIDAVKGFEDKVLAACTETILSVSKDDEKRIAVREQYLTEDKLVDYRIVTHKRSDFGTVQADLHTPFASHHLSYNAEVKTLNHKIESSIGDSFQETLIKAELAFASSYYQEHLLSPIEKLKTTIVNGLSSVDKIAKMVEPPKGSVNFVEDIEAAVGNFLNQSGL